MDQEQEPRERSFIRELIPDWRPTGEHKLRAARIAILVVVVVLTVLLLLYLIGLLFGVTLGNVLKVMAVPITVGAAVPFLNWLQRNREEKLERQRAQDEALQAYLEQMSQLLTDKERPLHRCQPSDKLSFVARSRTLTVLSRLDPERNVRVVQFLYEAGLIFSSSGVVQLSRADLREIDLSAADLREIHLGMAVLTDAKLLGAELREAKLRRVHLSGADLTYATLPRADLRGADLRSAELRNTHLKGSDLSGADLTEADLRYCYLSEADLTGAYLNDTNLNEANLSEANLSYAHLSEANLRSADLTGVNLSGADLNDARLNGADLIGADLTNAKGWTEEQLTAARSLEGATMPTGQKYEDWLKSSEEDRQGG